MKKIFKIPFIEFVELISGYNEIKEYSFSINYTDEITGTIEELDKFIKGFDGDFIELKKEIYKLKEKSKHSYSTIDIRNYFKNITNNYNKQDIETVLFDMDVFEHQTLYDTIDNILHHKYVDNKWEIPLYKKSIPTEKEEIEFFDYKQMRDKIFPFLTSDFHEIKLFLKSKLKEIDEIKEDILDVHSESERPEQNTDSLEDILLKNKFDYVIKLLEELSVTVDGSSILSVRKKGVLRGVIEGLKEKNILPNLSLSILSNLIAKHINLELKSKLNYSNTSEEYRKKTIDYIRNNPIS